ncbi:DUF418 domain-containing protein [Dokdonia sp. Asnod2-E02]|uniref:DUF418 domain-containing protein n=1 Tax=Dokdonia sp. Asnod2-E02 TaxID=3160574 RepID=UPI0038643D78
MLSPVNQNHRIVLLDILRGFAIFGIFVVNIEIMNCTFINGDAFAEQFTSVLDSLAVRVKQLFFYSKFFPIFSLLFGVGVSIQLASMKRKGIGHFFFYRRMFALFVFGVLHIIFLWSGDVIHLYAILGLLTLVVSRFKNNYLVICAVLLLLFPFYNSVATYLMKWVGYDMMSYLSTYTPDDIRETIRSGSYYDNVMLRIQEYKSNVGVLYVFLAPKAFAMFLIGLLLGREGVLHKLQDFALRIKRPVLIMFVVITIYRVIFLFFTWDTAFWKIDVWRSTLIYFQELCDVLTALFYVWLIISLYKNVIFKKMILPLRHVGRMALTNYILQSVISLFIFTSSGLSLYERLSPFETLVLAIVIFCLQVLLSNLWLRYFKFGPLEWLWRCVSYWKVLPLKKERI